MEKIFYNLSKHENRDIAFQNQIYEQESHNRALMR